MYEYKVMINFRTSPFTNCSEFRLVFLSLSFSSVFSFIFVLSSRFYNVSSFVSLLFSLIFFYSQIYCNKFYYILLYSQKFGNLCEERCIFFLQIKFLESLNYR